MYTPRAHLRKGALRPYYVLGGGGGGAWDLGKSIDYL